MIDETLGKIEARIHSSESISPERRDELLRLLVTLKSEVAALHKTHDQKARTIARFAEISTNEATRPEKDEASLNRSLNKLNSSVEGFETSHPRLVQIVNTISNTLSNLGI